MSVCQCDKVAINSIEKNYYISLLCHIEMGKNTCGFDLVEFTYQKKISYYAVMAISHSIEKMTNVKKELIFPNLLLISPIYLFKTQNGPNL